MVAVRCTTLCCCKSLIRVHGYFKGIGCVAEIAKIMVQFFKFGIVGLLSSCLGLGGYYIFLCLGCHYLLANVISWCISVFNAFYFNNRYVFKSSASWWNALMKAYISYGVSFVLGTGLLYILIEWCGESELKAPIYILFLTVPLNFVSNKFWTFKSR